MLRNPFLLSRVLLRLRPGSEDLIADLSAIAHTPDGSLWLGSDELNTLERLSPIGPMIFGEHQSFAIQDFIPLANNEDEIDIEGMDYSDSYLWFTGSHCPTRKKPKGKDTAKDIARLTEVEIKPNRCILGRIPIMNGEPVKACSMLNEDGNDRLLRAAQLQPTDTGNCLLTALITDPHLGPFITSNLPSKENGFDVEGLAVHQNRLFLGLRGPVIRGWAIILEIIVEETSEGMLTLQPIGESDRPYKKHFVNLSGLGIRELCFHGDDLLIMAGPTMELEGEMQVYRLTELLDQPTDSLTDTSSDALTVLFDFPFTVGSDHAEGLAIFPALDQTGLLVVYDSPNPVRWLAQEAVFADVFWLDRA